MVASTESDILRGVFEGQAGRDSLSPESARYLLRVGFQPWQHERVAELSDKANDGTLTATERAELDGYSHVGLMLTRLKARARRTLDAEGATP